MELPRGEFILIAIFFLLLLGLKFVSISSVGGGSDESQHAHVVWAWARGFVQYRDIFDNHMPLFQIMFAPVYGLIGDRADVLTWLRTAMLPLQIVMAWAVYRIARDLFSPRVALWAVILVGFYSNYHYFSLEFRTDVLWAACWLITIAELVSGPITWQRAARAGLAAGLAFATSMKTPLLLFSALAAALPLLFYRKSALAGMPPSKLAKNVAVFALATLLFPSLIATSFYLARAWPQFLYCVVQFNIGGSKRDVWLGIAQFAPLFACSIYIGYWMLRLANNHATRRAFVLMFSLCYIAAVRSFWPLVTRQDYLPVYPLLAIFFAASLVWISDWLRARSVRFVSNLFLPTAAVIELLLCIHSHPFWGPAMREHRRLLEEVQSLTTPAEFVLDAKGETIFRQRSIQPVLEDITLQDVRRGLVTIDVEKRCTETHTCLLAENGRYEQLSEKARRFIHDNYFPVDHGEIGVIGGVLRQAGPGQFVFRVVVPAEYVLIADGAPVEGLLDEQPYKGARFLQAGEHKFATYTEPTGLQFVWARAAEKGLIPRITLARR